MQISPSPGFREIIVGKIPKPYPLIMDPFDHVPRKALQHVVR
jgi:hypothetical protein